MLYYQPFIGTQECFYMLCWPTGNPEQAINGLSDERELMKTE